jgi:hypothetical protein
MADKKVTALTAATASDVADLAHIITDVATGATNKKITVANFLNKIPGFIGFSDTPQTVTNATAINITGTLGLLVTTTASAPAIANGVQGQIKVLVAITISGTSTVTPATMNDGASLAFAAAADAAILMYIGASGWAPISLAGAGTPGAGPTIA